MAAHHPSTQPEAEHRWPSRQLPLTSVAPGVADLEPLFFVATVGLIWPFSASGLHLSILACEEDFRLRRSRGQLRVNFTGPSASAVDATGIQIGDSVSLSLEGAEFETLENVTEKDVPWAVKRESGWCTIEIAPPPPSPLPLVAGSVLRATDPPQGRTAPLATPPTKPFSFSQSEDRWSTPGLFRRPISWLGNESSSPLSAQSYFGGDDDYDLEHRSKRPRFNSSFRLLQRSENTDGRSVQADRNTLESQSDGQGRHMAHKPPANKVQSSTNGNDGAGGNAPLPGVSEVSQAGGVRERPTLIPMPPPPLPPLDTRLDSNNIPDSPSLRPVLSANLPLVSPFLNYGLSGTDYTALDDTQLAAGPGENPTPVGSGSAVTAIQDPAPRPTSGASARILTLGASAFVEAPDQWRASLSDEERQLSDLDSERDSLFDEPSDGESIHRSVQRRKMNAKLRFAATSQPSKLSIEISSARIGVDFLTPRSEKPTTPHLYLPTPSPKTEKRSLHFPTSAPPRYGPSYSDIIERMESRSPTERKSIRWGFGRESLPSNLSAYFGRSGPTDDGERGRELFSFRRHDHTGKALRLEKPTHDPDPEVTTSPDQSGHRSDSTPEFESGVTTNLSDFPALCSLAWGAVVDMIGVVARRRLPKRAKGGQKDYYVTMRLVDSSTPYGITAIALRPYKEALPIVEVGDVVLLREFKITSQKRSLVATSTTNSAWAVWKNFGKDLAAVVSGPPVEYGSQEEKYVEAIGKWYASLDGSTREDLENESADEATAGEG